MGFEIDAERAKLIRSIPGSMVFAIKDGDRTRRLALTPGEPAGIGPELVAVLAASDERETCSDLRVAEVLVVGDGDLLVTPCGGCRQKLREFADLDVRVHVAGPEGVRRTFTVDELLPASFGPEHLFVDVSRDPGPGEQDALDADGG